VPQHPAQFATEFRRRKKFQNTPRPVTHPDDATSNFS